VYSMVQRRDKEKDSRYIQEASAPAAVTVYQTCNIMYICNSVNHDQVRVISHVDRIEGEPCDRLRYREKREICVSRVSLCHVCISNINRTLSQMIIYAAYRSHIWFKLHHIPSDFA